MNFFPSLLALLMKETYNLRLYFSRIFSINNLVSSNDIGSDKEIYTRFEPEK